MFELWVGTITGRGIFVPSHKVKTIRHKVEALAVGQQTADSYAADGWDLAVCNPGQDGMDESVIRCF